VSATASHYQLGPASPLCPCVSHTPLLGPPVSPSPFHCRARHDSSALSRAVQSHRRYPPTLRCCHHYASIPAHAASLSPLLGHFLLFPTETSSASFCHSHPTQAHWSQTPLPPLHPNYYTKRKRQPPATPCEHLLPGEPSSAENLNFPPLVWIVLPSAFHFDPLMPVSICPCLLLLEQLHGMCYHFF
jgi:hypothetical protein